MATHLAPLPKYVCNFVQFYFNMFPVLTILNITLIIVDTIPYISLFSSGAVLQQFHLISMMFKKLFTASFSKKNFFLLLGVVPQFS